MNKRSKEYESSVFKLFTLKRCIDKAVTSADIKRNFDAERLEVSIEIPYTRREFVKIIFPIDLVTDY